MVKRGNKTIDQTRELASKSVNGLFAKCSEEGKMMRTSQTKMKPASRDITLWGKN